MKKVVSVILCLFMLCGLVACSKSNISSEFSNYYINAEANTNKDNFEEVEIVEVIEENVENKNENANESNNESINVSENNNSISNNTSNNSNTNSNTNSKVEAPVVPSTPVVEEPTTPSTHETPSEPQYKTLKLHEKTTYNGVEGCFALESEVWDLDLVSIGLSDSNDVARRNFRSEYYNVDTNETIVFVGTFGPIPDSALADIMQAERVPVKVQ